MKYERYIFISLLAWTAYMIIGSKLGVIAGLIDYICVGGITYFLTSNTVIKWFNKVFK